MSTDDQFDEKLPGELKAVAAELKRLAPSADLLDRDRVMYLSGRASTTPCKNALRFVWPASTAALLLLSLTLGGMLLSSSRDQRQIGSFGNGLTVPNAVAHRSSSGEGTRIELAVADHQQSSYLQLRNTVLRGGVDALPSPRTEVRVNDPADPIPGMPLKFKYLGG